MGESQFLIDSGAAISIVSSKKFQYPATFDNRTVKSINGSIINCRGTVNLNITIKDLRRTFNFDFYICDIDFNVFGLDFLQSFNLKLDPANYLLIDGLTNLKSKTLNSNVVCSFVIENIKTPDLLAEFKNLLLPPDYDKSKTINKKFQHEINLKTENLRVSHSFRRLSPEKYKVAKLVFDDLLEKGLVIRSDSEYASPLHMVPKKAGSWRPTGDYRQLNKLTKVDKYPLPNIKDVTNNLAGSTVFSKIDLVKAFHNIPMKAEDAKKTAITTPFGLFEWRFMPFGLKNAPASFQRYIDTLLCSLDFIFVYVDDILVFSPDHSTHESHLRQLFTILEKANLRISVDKCEFFKDSLDFLGVHISDNGIQPPKYKIEALEKLKVPSTQKELRRYLGMFGYYRHFIDHYATLTNSLNMLCNCDPREFKWTSDNTECFRKLKEALVKATCLVFPHNTTRVTLTTDASNVAIGGVLHDEEKRPLGFFSRVLSTNEKTWSTFDRELLACVASVRHFRHLIEGRELILLTDHKPIVSAYNKKTESVSPRHSRFLSFLAEFVDEIDYIKGEQNITADILSRISSISTSIIDTEQLLIELEADSELKEIITKKPNWLQKDSKGLFVDTNLLHERPYIPASLRHQIFKKFHNLAHPGQKGTCRLLNERFVWPGLTRDVKKWVKECTSCQKSKVVRHIKTAPQKFGPSNKLQVIHIDLVVMPPSQQHGYTNLLTMIDRATGWIEATPLMTTTADAIVDALIRVWFARFGVPLKVITDRGPQFESSIMHEISKRIGFSKVRTTAYHPQANGKIERAHRRLKEGLRTLQNDWYVSLPWVLFAIRITPQSRGEYSPFTLLTGTYALSPPIHNSPSGNETSSLVESFSNLPFHDNDQSLSIPKPLENAKWVYVRVDRIKRPLEAPYSGPYKILQVFPKYSLIRISDSKVDSVSNDRLKIAHIPTESSIHNNSSDITIDHNYDSPTSSHHFIDNSSHHDTSSDFSNGDSSVSISHFHLHDSSKISTPSANVFRSGRKVHFNRWKSYLTY